MYSENMVQLLGNIPFYFSSMVMMRHRLSQFPICIASVCMRELFSSKSFLSESMTFVRANLSKQRTEIQRPRILCTERYLIPAFSNKGLLFGPFDLLTSRYE
jgi:hypothetical protein